MKKYLVIPVLFLTLFALVACNSNNNEKANDKNGENDADSNIIEVKHELGTVEIEKNPKNIVVFDFGMLDTLDSLGIDVVGLPQMSIPSYLDKYTSEQYENLGSLKEPDFEKINSIDPDLIIISGRQAELYDELSKLGPVLYVGLDQSRYIDSFKENTRIIGEIFDKQDEVDDFLSDLDTQIAEINEKVSNSNKKALILLANEDKISAYGAGSRFGIIHDVFGIPAVDDDIEESTHGMNVTFEYVVEQNPDIIYVIDRSAAIGDESAANDIVENELIAKTTAMKNEDIHYLSPDIWYLSGGGIDSIQKMIEEIEKSLD